jgi:Domain of unknown function (DUF4288)
MGYIPPDAKWYIAELVEEITIEGDMRNVVHKNLVLIRADSPDEAYDKAIELGKQSELSYENPAGRLVKTRFWGLGELTAIQDDLADGAELLYEEKVGVPRDQIEKEMPAKEELAVFRPFGLSEKPDYTCKDIVDEAKRLIKKDGG